MRQAAGIRHRRLDAVGQAHRLPLAARRRPGRTASSSITGRVGTGFDDRDLEDLSARFEKLARKDSPFEAVPREARRGVKWVEPKLVAEIAFTEFTSDGILRHPSFLGLREDKKASEVKLERPRAGGEGHGRTTPRRP